jgi:hypothetical protein
LRMRAEQPLKWHKHKNNDKNYLEAKGIHRAPRSPLPYRYLPIA